MYRLMFKQRVEDDFEKTKGFGCVLESIIDAGDGYPEKKNILYRDAIMESETVKTLEDAKPILKKSVVDHLNKIISIVEETE